MDTPTETVIPVVGDNMGVVTIVYDVAYFCTSEVICGVASAKDGGGSTQERCFCISKNSPSTNILRMYIC